MKKAVYETVGRGENSSPDNEDKQGVSRKVNVHMCFLTLLRALRRHIDSVANDEAIQHKILSRYGMGDPRLHGRFRYRGLDHINSSKRQFCLEK